MSKSSTPYLVVLGGLWGSMFFFNEIGLRGFGPIQLVLVRFAIASMVLLPYLWVRRIKLPRGLRIWCHIAVVALLANVATSIGYTLGQQHVDSGFTSVINSTIPVWTLLLALAFGAKRRVRWLQVVGMVVGLAGVILVISPWRTATGFTLSGAALCLLAALAYAGSYVYLERFLVEEDYSIVSITAAQFLCATGFLVVLAPIFEPNLPSPGSDALTACVVLAVLCTVLPTVVSFHVVAVSGPAVAALANYLIPVVGLVLGIVVLAEPMTATVLSGAVVVVFGVALCQLKIGDGNPTGGSKRRAAVPVPAIVAGADLRPRISYP